MVVAVAGGEQMQISLSVYWMFRERGVNCTEPQTDTVGNIDGSRDAYETSLEPAWAQHETFMKHLFRAQATFYFGPKIFPGPNMRDKIGPNIVPGPYQPVRAFLELETKPSSWILRFVFPSPLTQLAEVGLVILVAPVVNLVAGPSSCEAAHTSVHPARVTTEGTLGRLLSRYVLDGVYLTDKFRVMD